MALRTNEPFLSKFPTIPGSLPRYPRIDISDAPAFIRRMRSTLPASLVAALFFALPGASALADHAAHSPAKDVLAALKAATVEGETADGKTYRIVYKADGTARMEVGGKAHDGKWSVDKGGHYCETWTGLFDGKRRCTGIEVAGPLLILRGPIATTRTVISGGPAK